MQITAITTIIEWDAERGTSFILNPGDTGEAGDALAMRLIDEGAATADLPQLDHDDDGEPGGSEPHTPPALTGKNKADLIAIAEAEGVALEDGMTNPQIVAAIEEARAAATDDDGADAPPA